MSNDVRSKQFIKIFKREDGSYESMVQRVYRQIREADKSSTVTIATSKAQVSAIHNQLGREVNVCVEPFRRDTFPAIALAAAYLHDIKRLPEEEPIVVCPVDPYVDAAYFKAVSELGSLARGGEANLVLMGIEPTYPSEKYGYIIPVDGTAISEVRTFREKPDARTAEKYIQEGALWNGGVFAFRLGYVLERAHELIDFADYDDLYDQYEKLEKISFDYAVAEKEKNSKVMRFSGFWKDLGTWNTLTEEMAENIIGNAVLNNKCENTSVINELNMPLLCMGTKHLIVAASAEGILVSDKEQSSYIKPFVDAMEQAVMFAEKSWGSYRVLDVGENSMTIKVTLNSGHHMNYHSHERRDEVWTVVSGNGRTVVDGMEEPVRPGDVITMQAGCKHTVFAETELVLIEVQLGREISVYDKHKHELET